MRSAVDEVGEGDEGGGEADGGAVESRDEDLRVRVEGVCDVEVVGDEGAEPVFAEVGAFGEGAGDADVGAAERGVSIGTGRSLEEAFALRGEIAAFAGEDGDVDIVAGGDLAHQGREAVVEVQAEGIELLGEIEGYKGDFALCGQDDLLFRGGHGGSSLRAGLRS